MTAPLQPGDELVVTAKPPRREVPRLGWAAMIAIALALVAVAVLVIGLLIGAARGEREREQLACQVQRLGGQPIGDVKCPPTRKASPRPAASSSPRRPDVIVVMPPSSSSPGGYVLIAPSPGQRTSPASPAARPGPSPSRRATPSPSPLVQICPPGLPCFPRTDVPRPRSELLWPPCRR